MYEEFWHNKEPIGYRKYGGPIPKFEPDTDAGGRERLVHNCWGADGFPFAKMHFRAAPEDPDWEKRLDPATNIYKLIGRYKEAMIEQGREQELKGSLEDKPSEGETGIPQEDVEKMRKAIRQNDHVAIQEAMVALNKYDPTHKSFDERLKFWQQEFSKAWSPEFQKEETGTAAKDFVRESLQPWMPEEMNAMDKERQKYEERKRQALALRRKTEFTENTFDYNAMDPSDCAMTVVQANPAHSDWENSAIFGAQPGCLFGCHCSAQFEIGPYEAQYGDVGYQGSLEFARKYPKTKGRPTLPQIAIDNPEWKAPWEAGFSFEDYAPALGEMPEVDDPDSPFHQN